MRKINKFILSLLFVLSVVQLYPNSIDPECPIVALANDMSSASSEFRALIQNRDIFKAWNLLNRESPAFRTNVDELKLVSENLNEINEAGGYLRWKSLNIVRHQNWVQVDDIRNKINLRVGHVIEHLDLNAAETSFKGCHSEIALQNYIRNNPTYRYEFRNISYDLNSGGNNTSRVFEANPVVIKPDGTEIIKGNNGGVSSFFPQNWDKNRILDEVEYAIENNYGRIPTNINGNEFYGFSRDGNVEIHFYYNENNGSINSFFPKKR